MNQGDLFAFNMFCIWYTYSQFLLAFAFCRFSLIIRFFIPATTANDLRLRRISIPDFIHYIFVLSLFFKKRFSLFNVVCQTREVLLQFNNVFGMTRSLTGVWNRDLTQSMSALYFTICWTIKIMFKNVEC